MSVLVAEQRLEAVRFDFRPLIERFDSYAAWCAAGDAKYGEAFWIAESIKNELRRKWRRERPAWGEHEDYLAQARAFWEEYEEVNRLWLPNDPVFSGPKTGVAMSTTNSTWQLLAPASGQLRWLETFLGGEAVASTVMRVAVQRSAAGAGTVPATLTPEKASTRSSASASTLYGAVNANVAWGTTQEALSGNPFIVPAFNAFGGSDRWVPQPGEEFLQLNGEYASVRSLTGVGVISGHIIWEEL